MPAYHAKYQRFNLVSVAEQSVLSLAQLDTLKTGFDAMSGKDPDKIRVSLTFSSVQDIS